jgi:hypothetical protein
VLAVAEAGSAAGTWEGERSVIAIEIPPRQVRRSIGFRGGLPNVSVHQPPIRIERFCMLAASQVTART